MIALVESDDEPLVRLLEGLGSVYEREVRMPEDNHDINLFSVET